jgi:hypothetical protein
VKCVALSSPAAVQLDELVGVPTMGARLVKSSVPVLGSSKQAVAMCVHAIGRVAKAYGCLAGGVGAVSNEWCQGLSGRHKEVV